MSKTVHAPHAPTARFVDRALDVLNRAFEADPITMSNMCEHRTLCKKELAEDPTIQVMRDPDTHEDLVGVLGIINGILGIRPDGYGPVCMVVDDSGEMTGFAKTPDPPTKPGTPLEAAPET